MTDIREHLAHKPLLFDGGMGTYYKAAPGADCEMANLTDPEGVKKVHAEYLAAGAQAIKTNTFGLPRMAAAQTPVTLPLRRTPPSSLTSARPRTPKLPRPVAPTALWRSSSPHWVQRTFCSRRSAPMWALWRR